MLSNLKEEVVGGGCATHLERDNDKWVDVRGMYMGVSKNTYTSNGWFIMENPIKNGWFGETHYFRKHPYRWILVSSKPKLFDSTPAMHAIIVLFLESPIPFKNTPVDVNTTDAKPIFWKKTYQWTPKQKLQ